MSILRNCVHCFINYPKISNADACFKRSNFKDTMLTISNTLFQIHQRGSLDPYYHLIKRKTMEKEDILRGIMEQYLSANTAYANYKIQNNILARFHNEHLSSYENNLFDHYLNSDNEHENAITIARMLNLKTYLDLPYDHWNMCRNNLFIKEIQDVSSPYNNYYPIVRLFGNCIRYSSHIEPYAYLTTYSTSDLININILDKSYRFQDRDRPVYAYNTLPISGSLLNNDNTQLSTFLDNNKDAYILENDTCYKHVFYFDEQASDVACCYNDNNMFIRAHCLFHKQFRGVQLLEVQGRTLKLITYGYNYIQYYHKNNPCITHIDDKYNNTEHSIAPNDEQDHPIVKKLKVIGSIFDKDYILDGPKQSLSRLIEADDIDQSFGEKVKNNL